jgi:hypothetical protein
MIFDSFWLQRYKNIFRYQSNLLLFLIFIAIFEKRSKLVVSQRGKETKGRKQREGNIGKKEEVEEGGLLLFWFCVVFD